MIVPWYARFQEGRRTAAFFSYGAAFFMVLLVAGCGTGSNVVRTTFGDLFSDIGSDVSEYAGSIPYASLDVSVNGRGGLIVLAEVSGSQTYFQSAAHEAVVLRHGYLVQTAGLDANLQMTRLRSDAARVDKQVIPWQQAQAGEPITYIVQREWRDAEGVPHAGVATATLKCRRQAVPVELPLATLPLQRCDETLVWASGEKTRSVLWRDPEERMLWQVHTVPWPGGPEVAWRVARPWW